MQNVQTVENKIRARVLFVDDCSLQRRLVMASVLAENHNLELAEDAFKALSLILRHPWGFYSYIVTDYEMPFYNGLNLAEAVYSAYYPSKIFIHTSVPKVCIETKWSKFPLNVFEKGHFLEITEAINRNIINRA